LNGTGSLLRFPVELQIYQRYLWSQLSLPDMLGFQFFPDRSDSPLISDKLSSSSCEEKILINDDTFGHLKMVKTVREYITVFESTVRSTTEMKRKKQ